MLRKRDACDSPMGRLRDGRGTQVCRLCSVELAIIFFFARTIFLGYKIYPFSRMYALHRPPKRVVTLDSSQRDVPVGV